MSATFYAFLCKKSLFPVQPMVIAPQTFVPTPYEHISRKSHGHTFKKTPFPNITSTNLLPSIYEG